MGLTSSDSEEINVHSRITASAKPLHRSDASWDLFHSLCVCDLLFKVTEGMRQRHGPLVPILYLEQVRPVVVVSHEVAVYPSSEEQPLQAVDRPDN